MLRCDAHVPGGPLPGGTVPLARKHVLCVAAVAFCCSTLFSPKPFEAKVTRVERTHCRARGQRIKQRFILRSHRLL